MDYKEYFASVKGTGVISTADNKGVVNAAIYSTPYSADNGLLSFIMRSRKTHENISVNPHACFLFIEAGKIAGKRIYLTKVREEKNSESLSAYRSDCKKDGCDPNEDLYQVFFSVDKELPLVGDNEK